MEDDSIYNALIIALSIGIIVVILTLIIARPEPESFSELYFEDHRNLPEFIELNKDYQYSFSINNHENQNYTYNISMIKELYTINYECEQSDIYLETINQSEYDRYIPDLELPSDMGFVYAAYEYVPTRIATTKDPSLLIKEKNYTLSFNFQIKSGAGQIVTQFNDIYNNRLYAIIINEQTQKIYILDAQGNQVEESAIIPKNLVSRLKIDVSDNIIKVHLNNEQIFNVMIVEKSLTGGFFSFETTKTYAVLTNIHLTRENEATQDIYLKISDITQDLVHLDYEQTRGVNYFEYNLTTPDDFFIVNIDNATRVSYITKYHANQSINISSYTLDLSYRLINGESFSIGISEGYEIYFNRDYFKLFQGGEFTYLNNVTVRPRNWHRLRLDVFYDQAWLYFDYNLIARFNITEPEGKPYIKTYDSEVNFNYYYMYSNIAPNQIKYEHEKNELTKTSNVPLPLSFLMPFIGSDDDTKEYIQTRYEREKIKWDNYRISLQYIENEPSAPEFHVNDLNKTLYTLRINSTAQFSYLNNSVYKNITVNLTDIRLHTIYIDVRNNSLNLWVDGKNILSDMVDASKGVFLTNNTQGIDITRLNIIDRDSSEIREYRPDIRTCNPVLKKKFKIEKQFTIPKDESYKFTTKFSIEEHFDIAKIIVQIKDDQNIHFWVKQI